MVFNDDEMPPPPITGSEEEYVIMKKSLYDKKEVSMADDDVKVLVQMEATSSAKVREGLDLVAVLDVSGSMTGHRIESSKRAMQFVIMKLTPLDRLSIVTFNSTAERLCPLRCMTPAAQGELKVIVDGLTAHGGTDIKSGLVMGLDVLGSRVHTESRSPEIFLMSDGHNAGRTTGDPSLVNPGDVQVYTFGFGIESDHVLLTKIARNSICGTFNNVPDGTNLSESFAQLLAGLLTVVAQDLEVTFTPSKEGSSDLDTITVPSVYDYKQTTDDKGAITIKFGNLYSGEVRKVTVDFKLKNRVSEELEDFFITLATAKYTYAGQKNHHPGLNIRVKRTDNPSPPTGSLEERTVEAEELRLLYVQNIVQASTLADAGRLAEAREKVEEAKNAIENIMLDDEEKTVNVLRAELLQLSNYMHTQELYKEHGHPYALATILSHGRQRTAGRGDEHEVFSLYATPRMISYLHQVKEFEKNPHLPVHSADHDL